MAKPRDSSAALWRLLDANVNRAREGLRVLEDTARFVLSRPAEAKALRELRHALDRAVRRHYRRLVEARDVSRDSGRANPSASYEGGVADLVSANFKRCEEALRVLEEYGRILSPDGVAVMQRIRFDIYGTEKALQRRP